ncbi:hypothetical protein GBN24_08010 [Plesiomonas shigelloides]|uniref:YhfG family protein n=1 Tax=Plesiomonas shigelloides TaxID=703 RepID=UPI0012618959|nr:YhfG family protein [Plesiomonas shigelloides]KAB7690709.1 hypothetical protein GBN24_08010 [Plesiomonas shigelloides]
MMKYEMLVLAAMTRLHNPNTKAIVEATGISERKVQTVVNGLIDNLGMKIKRIPTGRTFTFSIESWGVFESGEQVRSRLTDIQLLHSERPRSSYAAKHAYFESVKMHNFKESMRLEGIEVEPSALVSTASDRSAIRLQLIEKYKMLGSEGLLHG